MTVRAVELGGEARSPVDWASYAAVYDLMLDHNPAYHAIVERYRRFVGGLDLAPGSRLVDLGAGTGNFSLAAARLHPQATVVHVDADAAMNARARVKLAAQGLHNVEVRTGDVGALDVPAASVAVVTAVHSLYAMPDPTDLIRRSFTWLAPGGWMFACDPGAPFDVGDWTRYVFRSAWRAHGPAYAVRTFWRARVAVRENRRIARALDQGRYWRHDAAAFRAAFEGAGFAVVAEERAFRDASDLIIVRKPLAPAPSPAPFA